jgi:hypothetical protein
MWSSPIFAGFGETDVLATGVLALARLLGGLAAEYSECMVTI